MAKARKSQSKEVDKKSKLPLQWHIVHRLTKDRIFKIRTPRGHGTGFYIGSYGNNRNLAAVATACHVIDYEHDWDEPIKMYHEESGSEALLKSHERVIFTYPSSDIAIIVFSKPPKMNLPDGETPYFRNDKTIYQGVDISWCGFPSVQPDKLCFFHGYISCNLEQQGYLVDGVVINGVSGGPVFFVDGETNLPILFGVISAYKPNNHAAGPLPGLGVISAIPQEFEAQVASFRNLSSVSKEAAKSKVELSERNSTNEN